MTVVAVDTTVGGTKLLDGGTDGYTGSVFVKNTHATTSIYIGPHGLTSGTGYLLKAGEQVGPVGFASDSVDLYALSASGSVNVALLLSDVGAIPAAMMSSLALTSDRTDRVPLSITGISAQSADLLEVFNSTGTLLWSINHVGVLASGVNSEVALGRGGSSITTNTNGGTPLTVYAKTGQTATIFEVQDENGDSVFEIRADGTVHIKTAGTVHADL